MTEKETGFGVSEDQELEPLSPAETGAEWLNNQKEAYVSLEQVAGEKIQLPMDLRNRGGDVGAEIASILLFASGVATYFGGFVVSHELAPMADALAGSWEMYPVRFYGEMVSVSGAFMALLGAYAMNKVKSS